MTTFRCILIAVFIGGFAQFAGSCNERAARREFLDEPTVATVRELGDRLPRNRRLRVKDGRFLPAKSVVHWNTMRGMKIDSSERIFVPLIPGDAPTNAVPRVLLAASVEQVKHLADLRDPWGEGIELYRLPTTNSRRRRSSISPASTETPRRGRSWSSSTRPSFRAARRGP